MSQKIKEFFTKIFPTILLTTLIVGTIVYAWQEPTENPPGGNVPAPIHVGGTQYKSGGLGIGGLFETYYFTNLALTELGGTCAQPRPFPTVGIGLRCATTKLDVAGDIKARGNIILPRLPTEHPIPGRELVLESWSTDMTTEGTDDRSISYEEWNNGTETCTPQPGVSPGNIKKVQFRCIAGTHNDNYSCIDYYIITRNSYTDYHVRTATCHANTSKYSIRTDSGTLQFLNTANEVKLTLGQDGRLDVFGGLRLTPSTQPSAANGVIYYDASQNKFRCYQAGQWVDCIGGGTGGGIGGSGTKGFIARFNSTSTIENSTIYDKTIAVSIPQICIPIGGRGSGCMGLIGIGTTEPTVPLEVIGTIKSTLGDIVVQSNATQIWKYIYQESRGYRSTSERNRNAIPRCNNEGTGGAVDCDRDDDASECNLTGGEVIRGDPNSAPPKCYSWYLAQPGNVPAAHLFVKNREPSSGGWVIASTGYPGDTIAIGGDAGGNDLEIKIIAPRSRNLVSLWNRHSEVNDLSNLQLKELYARGKVNTPRVESDSLLLKPFTPDGSPPPALNGTIYYDASQNKFRCYQAGQWVDCIGGGGGGGFWTQTGTNLYPSNLTWNVGIGTNTPGSKLEVAGETRINPPSGNSILTFQIGGSEKAQIYAASSDGSLRFRTPGNDQMVILPNGNVGIGTTAPNQKLSIVNGNVSLVDGNIYLSNTEYCVPGGGWYYTRNLVNIPEHKTDYPRCSCDQNDATKDCDEVFSAGNQTAAYCYDWWRYESGYPRSDRYKREYYSSGQCMWTPAPQIHFTDLETPAWTYTLKNKVGTLQFISGMDPERPRLTIGADGNTTISGKLGTAGYTSTQNLPSGWGGGVNTWDVVAQASIAARQICLDRTPTTTDWDLNCISGNWPTTGPTTGYWTQSLSYLYPSDSTWNVGIGIERATQKLTVAGNIGIKAGADAFIGTLDEYALSLKTDNQDRIFITKTGKVGIGTTEPKATLDVSGEIKAKWLKIDLAWSDADYQTGQLGYIIKENSSICDEANERGNIYIATSRDGRRDCMCWCGLRNMQYRLMCVCP